ncbi:MULTISPECIES: hydrogenase formation protein HypD [Aminobacterium]|jgi:hydrogenase expression/formation protein HypD|uniref:hydrogenase formation protein HypD n=1 Tax=Aminobacterium TaxID=81466 RepID=UPI000A59F731|nr:hydrogenase formation protein HypD [Aminobacterium sp. EBM-42]MDD2378923.1 hydrogenase formation protein HypD [Aminobacterium colombiense]MDD3767720.1 hydrogenase formation protein HypD [Aminobacterium colombiense]MDD4265122.1 hydrogenase formation protein HypD [Aminobacterium colombiense]
MRYISTQKKAMSPFDRKPGQIEASYTAHHVIEAIGQRLTKPLTFMEVCGTHTVSIFRSGIRSVLPPGLSLISGPGCPVCVTDQGEIDCAINLLDMPDITMATYGDMLRVPGTRGSLSERKSDGKDVRLITSAAQALSIAEDNPEREIVFLAVGFETTAPATAATILEATEKNITNFSILVYHKQTPPVLEQLVKDPDLKINGFILPGHVSVILGHKAYRFLADHYGVPCAIAGFEPMDILLAIADLVFQHSNGETALHSLYPRAVRPEGNQKALDLISKVFTPCSARWRGLGLIPSSGYALKDEFAAFDALLRFGITIPTPKPPAGCCCGDVLAGHITPLKCPLFAAACTPMTPVGPCMVSSEGSCSAYYKYNRGGASPWKRSPSATEAADD